MFPKSWAPQKKPSRGEADAVALGKKNKRPNKALNSTVISRFFNAYELVFLKVF